jgi:hypothetical protein
MQHSAVVVLVLVTLLIVSLISYSTPIEAKIDSDRVRVIGPNVTDSKGERKEYVTVDEAVVITSQVMATRQYVELPLTAITEIRDDIGITVYLDVFTYEKPVADPDGFTLTNVTWQPEEMGEYQISVIVLSDLTSPEIMSWRRTTELSILDPCYLPNCRVLDKNASYRENYRSVATSELGLVEQQTFTGLLTYLEDDPCLIMKLKRCTPYKLDDMGVYAGSDNLDEFIGQVRIRDLSLPSL